MEDIQQAVDEANALVAKACDLLHAAGVLTESMPVARVQWIHIDHV